MKQIYTGYKWRALKPEEIEIMDATRVLPFKPEEPEAGDIHEGVSGVNDFVQFTGEENEKEFLEKCLEQWETAAEKMPIMAMIQLGALFAEVRHRVVELEAKE